MTSEFWVNRKRALVKNANPVPYSESEQIRPDRELRSVAPDYYIAVTPYSFPGAETRTARFANFLRTERKVL